MHVSDHDMLIRIDEKLNHVATKSDLNNALDEHIEKHHKRLTAPTLNKERVIWIISAAIASAIAGFSAF